MTANSSTALMENSIYLKSVPLVFDDHGSKLLEALFEQQKKSQLCDLSLVVENVSFPAHKCILAAYSEYFHALFDQGKQSDDAGSKACSVTTIHLSSITLNTFIPILHYLYTSRLHVFAENLRDVMRTARKLQISKIVKACEKLLDDNVVLPSVHEVCSKQSSDTIVTQSASSESVLYVDLRSEDDEAFHPAHAVSSFGKSVEATMGQTVQGSTAYSSDLKQKMGRTQKKKGFPKKIHQSPSAGSSAIPDTPLPPAQSIPTVSPASIFGRVGATQTGRGRALSSPILPMVSSSDNLKSTPSTGSLSFDSSLPFETNLEALGSFLAGDTSLLESMQSENLSSSVPITAVSSTVEKPPTVGQTKASSSAEVMQPSIYTCKECFKYFTNLSDAIHHFYSEHRSVTIADKTSASGQKIGKSNIHSCPHCGRIFNNKNNLKRHILIKHTSDRRFKCSACGRKYAIRQSLKYHMKSVHGKGMEKETMEESSPLPPTSTNYNFDQFPPSTNTTIDTFSFSVSASNTNFGDTFQHIATSSCTSAITSPGVYLTSASIQSDATAAGSSATSADNNETNMPTIQRIESIRSDDVDQSPLVSDPKPAKQSDLKIASSSPISKASPIYQGLSLSMLSAAGASPYPQAAAPGLTNLLPVYPMDTSKAATTSRQTSEITPRLHRCDYCSRIFSTAHAYTRHRRSCHKHECPICHRGFSQLGNMRRHIKIFHSDQKPYKCHICHKAYGIKQSFRYHMRDKHGSLEVPKLTSELSSQQSQADNI